MIATDRPNLKLETSESDDLIEYRPISGWAIATLLLGVLSVSAVATSYLWIVPIAAIIVGGATLSAIARGGGAVIGRGLTVNGMALAVVFLTWAVSGHYSRRNAIFNDARVHAERWLEMVKNGEHDEAYQAHLPVGATKSPKLSFDAFYAEKPGLRQDIERYFGTTPMKEFHQFRETGTFVYGGGVGVSHASTIQTDIVKLRFRWDFRDRDHPYSIPFILTLKRLDRAAKVFYWTVETAEIDFSRIPPQQRPVP